MERGKKKKEVRLCRRYLEQAGTSETTRGSVAHQDQAPGPVVQDNKTSERKKISVGPKGLVYSSHKRHGSSHQNEASQQVTVSQKTTMYICHKNGV